MWIFGYGSLIWKIDFPIESRVIGYVKGFHRRFYQLSTDHRGTPANPGRVVTLLNSSNKEDQVWGIAYKIGGSNIDAIIDQVDYREKGGYKRQSVLFYPSDCDSKPFEITVYVASLDNFQYGGEADLDEIATQVVKSIGPSGTNIEYILNLANAMREIAPNVRDDHLFALETKVLELTKNIPSS